MIHPLKFSRERADKIFFWSDLHIKHAKSFILEPRGFKTAEEAENTLIERWNSKISNDCAVFHLGDFVVGAGDKGKEALLSFLRRVNFSEVYLCRGNHGSGWDQLFTECLKHQYINEDYSVWFGLDGSNSKVVKLIPNYYEIAIGGQMVVLSHYPILSFNGASKNSFHLSGHCHNNLSKIPWLRDNYLNRRVMDIGVEAQPYPLSFTEIVKILGNRPKAEIDHH